MEYTFISGATGGIGKAFVFACAKRGESLYLTGRNIDRLKALKDEVESEFGVEVHAFACDLTVLEDRKSMLDDIDTKHLKFKKIINVAGVDIQKPFLDYTEEKLLFQLRVNCEATVHLTYCLAKRLAENAGILTVSSMSGQSPMPYFALYSASKAMLTNFFTAFHYEMKTKGVKVTTVLPGGVYTRPDIIEDIKGQGVWGKLSAKSPEFVAEKSLKALSKNKIKYIPGGFNRFLNFIMKLAPKRIVLSFIARRWKKQTKDAF